MLRKQSQEVSKNYPELKLELNKIVNYTKLRNASPRKPMQNIEEEKSDEHSSGSDGYASNISSVEIDEGLQIANLSSQSRKQKKGKNGSSFKQERRSLVYQLNSDDD
jgi:hypothetical protein